MPAIPPTAVSITDHTEKKLSPHSAGIYPPIAEPIAIKIQIKDFEFITSKEI
jgi:hypothetical protein